MGVASVICTVLVWHSTLASLSIFLFLRSFGSGVAKCLRTVFNQIRHWPQPWKSGLTIRTTKRKKKEWECSPGRISLCSCLESEPVFLPLNLLFFFFSCLLIYSFFCPRFIHCVYLVFPLILLYQPTQNDELSTISLVPFTCKQISLCSQYNLY